MPKRSERRPLLVTLMTDSMPTKPNADAAVSGENPTSMKNATVCTIIVNIPAAVQKKA